MAQFFSKTKKLSLETYLTEISSPMIDYAFSIFGKSSTNAEVVKKALSVVHRLKSNFHHLAIKNKISKPIQEECDQPK